MTVWFVPKELAIPMCLEQGVNCYHCEYYSPHEEGSNEGCCLWRSVPPIMKANKEICHEWKQKHD
jgi:hypothetical protein